MTGKKLISRLPWIGKFILLQVIAMGFIIASFAQQFDAAYYDLQKKYKDQWANEALMNLNGRTIGYYNSVTLSWGYQAGVQWYGYTLSLMTDRAVASLETAAGLELGMGPSLAIVDKGFTKVLSTTTLDKDIYAFAYNQKGLEAGSSIKGTKITRIHP